jgi:pimeloyl-ACP methyl ester carboxylesterase
MPKPPPRTSSDLTKPFLQFSHANGFPAGCYAAMLRGLAPRYRIGAIEAIGTHPRYPVTEGWPLLVQQLIDTLERERAGEPVFGVGHSLGAYLTFFAAAQRPELFCAIVMIDAPVIGALKGRLLGASKRIGIVDRVTPAGATRDRRAEWASREEAKAHFRSRRLFRDFTEECLDDYVRHAVVGRENHAGKDSRYRLKIDPAIEYQIYRTIPHDMHRQLRRLRVPAGFIGGTHSDVLRRVGMAQMRGRGFLKRRVPGGHLFPFEHPAQAAAAIGELLEELAG